MRIFARLASGYCNLRQPQFKWKLVKTPYCLHCKKKEESITHFLLECPKFDSSRTQLFDHLRDLWTQTNPFARVPPPTTFSARTLITAHDFKQTIQLEVLQAVANHQRKPGS